MKFLTVQCSLAARRLHPHDVAAQGSHVNRVEAGIFYETSDGAVCPLVVARIEHHDAILPHGLGLEAGGHGIVRLDEPGALSPTGVERGNAQTIGQIEDSEVPELVSFKLVGGVDQ
jgi:hypothetical protein